MLIRTCLVVLCALCAGVLYADPPKPGDDAPNFKAAGRLINPPEFARELKDCKGDVILIYEWHMRDSTRIALSDIQSRWEKYGGKGLQVFAIHRLSFEKWPQVDAFCKKNKYTFCVPMGGFYDDKNDFFGYKEGKDFHTGVVGVDGKVAWYGKDDGWKTALDEELGKLVYPNLGKHEVHGDAKQAAEQLAKREFGRAINSAERQLAGEVSDEARADLELVIERAKWVADTRNERIKTWKEEGRYDLVMKALEALKAEFKPHDIGDAANDEIKALKKDRSLKNELKAFNLLDGLMAKDGANDHIRYINSLRSFARGQRNTKAAEIAEKLAREIEQEMED